jgi:hypothetical protein
MVVLIRATGAGLKAFLSKSRVSTGSSLAGEHHVVDSWQVWTKSAMEGGGKSMDNLKDLSKCWDNKVSCHTCLGDIDTPCSFFFGMIFVDQIP